ncbi:MAG: L-2-hydroxyglutarate oxidase [Actinomycetota bacterium]|nr:L-2-hydroxyglutarate oxidase [Actinomycetota bacterium]MDQ2955591.1 L-2-hydroxyglutarate oxidase [Actinomycetota bacterium]
MTRYLVVGGGIVGLATARALLEADPAGELTLLEKEPDLALHQTGRNSGVIHSGIYYPPGSAKAVMCKAGAESMTRFAQKHAIPLIRTGKLIVATDDSELPGLAKLYERGLANGIEVQRLVPEQAREYEPFVRAIAAVRVSATAITDYSAVCRALAAELTAAGAELRLGATVTGLVRHGARTTVESGVGSFTADVVINCAGLHADRVAAKDDGDGERVDSRIVPFRGEYYELRPEARHLVKGLIYPVPDPDFPFLGVHLTKMVDGAVHAGPNAVLALAREGYDWHTVRPADVAAVLRFGGFWRLARKNFGAGMMEVARSLSKKRFAASLARLVPEISAADLVPSHAGVRAQALRSDGGLVDDFLIVQRGRNVHVLNAPSPAATSSLEIGKHIAALATKS